MSLAADAVTGIPTTAHPRIESRLLADVGDREDLQAYRGSGGYRPVEDPSALLIDVDAAGLRGRGGAAFPTARKLSTVRTGRGVPVVVANGEEGEPMSVKDRWLLRHRPHLVLDGLRLAASMVGSRDVHVYVADGPATQSVQEAVDELAAAGQLSIDFKITAVDPSYVAGEETAVVQALNGGPALPMDKPPRPFEAGVAGRPTLINNVETLANLPLIQRLGATRYRDLGTDFAPGTFLMTLTGITRTGLYEIPFGETLREVLAWLGEDLDQVAGFLMGGYFAGVLGVAALDIPLEYNAISAAGSGLGCGAIAVISKDMCPVGVSAGVMAYFARENAGQCGSCFNGTAAMAAVLDALRNHQAEKADIDRLARWSTVLRGRGACGTLDGATNVAATLLREFPDAVSTHLHGSCGVCSAGYRPSDPPFAIGLHRD